jgi:peptide/nickel transport system substrate-binding protein
MEKSKMWNKVELSIVVLVLIGIIVSSGTMIYTFNTMSNLSTLTDDVSALTENVGNLTSSVRDLATITALLAESMGQLNQTLADLQARLAAIEASLAAQAKETIIVGTTDSVELTLDPAQAYDYFGWCIMQQISATLISVAPNSTTGADFEPNLAQSWNVSSDLLTWDFTLRQGITFPDGTVFNATHVKYSFDRAIDLIPSIPEGAPAGLEYNKIINRTDVLSTYTVRFVLNFPFSAFLGVLSCRASAIVDPTYAPLMTQVNYTEGNARGSTPLAFVGPYYLSTWTRVGSSDIEIRLDANPHYWNATSGYPKTKHIIFRFYADSSTLRLAIEAGDIDMAFRHISPTDALDLDQSANVNVWWGTGAFVQYLCFQEKRAPFNDTRVRVAVAAALNRSSMCETVFLGLSSPLYSIIPPGMLGHTEAFKKLGDANYTYTRSLLAQLGYNESNKLTFELWYESTGHYPSSADQALLYKEALEDSGVISVTLKSASWANYKSNRDNEIMDAYVYGWYPDYVDPDDYAFLYWAAWLHTNYANATQVALYDQARATTNQTLRTQLYAQIDGMAVEQCSVVPLYVSGAWAVTKPTINGIYLDITQDMRYWLIYITD